MPPFFKSVIVMILRRKLKSIRLHEMPLWTGLRQGSIIQKADGWWRTLRARRL